MKLVAGLIKVSGLLLSLKLLLLLDGTVVRIVTLLAAAEADDVIIAGAKLQVLYFSKFLLVNLLKLAKGAFMSFLTAVVTDDLF